MPHEAALPTGIMRDRTSYRLIWGRARKESPRCDTTQPWSVPIASIDTIGESLDQAAQRIKGCGSCREPSGTYSQAIQRTITLREFALHRKVVCGTHCLAGSDSGAATRSYQELSHE